MPSAPRGTCITAHAHHFGRGVPLRTCAAQSRRADEEASVAAHITRRSRSAPFGLFDCSLRAMPPAASYKPERARFAPTAGLDQGPALQHHGWFNGDNMVTGGEREQRGGLQDGRPPADVDTAQPMIASPTWWAQLEDYGFCKKGEGACGLRRPAHGRKTADQHLRRPAFGVRAEGMLQVVEGVRQMRHTFGRTAGKGCGDRARLRAWRQPVCHSTLILGRA